MESNFQAGFRRAIVACMVALSATVLAACGGGDPNGGGSGGKLEAVNATSLESPTFITGSPSNPALTYITLRTGVVRTMVNGIPEKEPFLDLTGRTSADGEQGLLSIAFPDDYAESGLFYVYFTDRQQNINLVEFKRKTEFEADPDSERLVLKIPHPKTQSHFGGTIRFLGDDLYLATGDGGGKFDPRNNSQNLNSLLGKMLRIDPRQDGDKPYTIPEDNPLVGKPGRDEIFAWGFRNPFRWAFDTTVEPTHLYVADVGESALEEIDYLPLEKAKGANFGWPGLEGNKPGRGKVPKGAVMPVTVLPHPPYCSVTGGIVPVDGEGAPSSLVGKFVFTDFCKSDILTLAPGAGQLKPEKTGVELEMVTSFGQSGDGTLYATSLSGSVYRFEQ